MKATHSTQYTTDGALYLAFELANAEWRLGFTVGFGQSARQRKIPARDVDALDQEVTMAKKRFRLPEHAPVRSCYEAGREAFWLHRYLESKGIQNLVVDSASIEVNRRARRAKTDRLDLAKLLTMLLRYHSGEDKVWRIVQVPSVEAEDGRHLHRQLSKFKAERTRHTNRIKGLLIGQGVSLPVGKDFLEQLDAVRLWNDLPLLPGLRARLEREYRAYLHIDQQIREIEAERREWLRTAGHADAKKIRALLQLKGIGMNSAWLFVKEFYGWREFKNRREVGGLAGLTPTPYQSGDEAREQGISKAGNRPIRGMAVEIAWSWVRFQPKSEITLWFQERYAEGGKRMRKIGIVAVARKLLVALWRYLETGEIPAGAQLKE